MHGGIRRYRFSDCFSEKRELHIIWRFFGENRRSGGYGQMDVQENKGFMSTHKYKAELFHFIGQMKAAITITIIKTDSYEPAKKDFHKVSTGKAAIEISDFQSFCLLQRAPHKKPHSIIIFNRSDGDVCRKGLNGELHTTRIAADALLRFHVHSSGSEVVHF